MKLMKFRTILSTLILVTISAGAFDTMTNSFAQPPQSVQPDQTNYEIINHFKAGGNDGWDFLTMDNKRHQLLVTRGGNVQVIDVLSGKLLTTLTDFHGSHGIAIADDLGFITNGKSNSVAVIDLNALKPIKNINVTGTGPDAIIYEPLLKRVYTMNHKSGNITVIDAINLKVICTIQALGELEVAVTDGKGKVFVNSEETGEVVVIDTHSSKMEAHWKLGACEGPTGLAIDSKHNRLFSVCANHKMVVVDSNSGKLIAELPIGGKPDGAAFDAALGMVYSSNGDGTLTVVHEDDSDHFHVVENLATQIGARTMTIDPETHHIYLPAALYGPLPNVSAETPKPRAPILADSFNILVVAPKVN